VPRWLIGLMEKDLWHECGDIAGIVAELFGQCFSFGSLNISKDAYGIPEESACLERTFDWYSRTPEVNSAWDIFYSSPTLQTLYQKMWKTVAGKFSASPGVIGYDLINEPLNANFFKDPWRIEPGLVDKEILQPMYTDVFKVILAEDPSAIAFYEPTPFPDTYPSNHGFPFGAGVKSTGFTTGAGADAAHQCLSFHIYCCGFAVTDCTREGDIPGDGSSAIADEWAVQAVSKRDEDAKRVGGGKFLTEFGACSGSEQCVMEIERVTSAADVAMHSWAYWQFKYNHDITTVSGPAEGVYDLEGNLQTKKVSALSRTYAPSIAGKPLVTKYNGSTGAYHLRYSAVSTTAHLLTDIFLNEDLMYNNGYELSIQNAKLYSKEHNHLFIKADRPNIDVDIALSKKVATLSSAESGWFHLSDDDWIKWELDKDAQTPGFEFSDADNLTSWRMLRFIGDDRSAPCSLELQGSNQGPKNCELDAESMHNFLFSYSIEVWKTKTLGVHGNTDTIKADYFGPLLNKRIKFTWAGMGVQQDEMVV